MHTVSTHVWWLPVVSLALTFRIAGPVQQHTTVTTFQTYPILTVQKHSIPDRDIWTFLFSSTFRLAVVITQRYRDEQWECTADLQYYFFMHSLPMELDTGAAITSWLRPVADVCCLGVQ